MLALPADHVIADEAAFQQAVQQAAQAAHDGYLATFGIVPQRVETGYGYIRQERSFRACRPEKWLPLWKNRML